MLKQRQASIESFVRYEVGEGVVRTVKDFASEVEELAKQIEKPDYIFHASGTGSTQAGIVVGLDRVGWSDVKCIGISVARQYKRGKKVISEFANMLAEHYSHYNY